VRDAQHGAPHAMCPHTTDIRALYYYIRVLILKKKKRQVRDAQHGAPHAMCPHTATYVLSYYYYTRVLILKKKQALLYTCPHPKKKKQALLYTCPHPKKKKQALLYTCHHPKKKKQASARSATRCPPRVHSDTFALALETLRTISGSRSSCPPPQTAHLPTPLRRVTITSFPYQRLTSPIAVVLLVHADVC
jgi:hypothetical protein